uniref:Betacellulin, epidermal growth factor family member n=1 Tax=Oryzias latipes TaxID=8090 RepID=A0A3P9LQS7_ORYLA
MAEVYKLYMGIITALALCKYSLAEWNSTDEPTNQTMTHCHFHGDQDNCTGKEDTEEWNGHFSRCPEELTFYCVHGDCRYVEEQKTPSCRCQRGYTGSRCEYVDLGLHKGERRHLIIGCIVALLALLVVLILGICICSNRRFKLWWRRRRRTEEPKKETEKLKMIKASAANATDSIETTNINSV